MAAKVNCSICGKLTDPTLENCPHCGSPVDMGRVGGSAAPVAPPVDVPDGGGDHCPSCKAPVQDGDIVCVRCGVNLLTGHQVAQKQDEFVPTQTNRTPMLIGALVVAVVLLVAALGFVLLRDPVNNARQAARSGDLLGAINMLQKHTDSFEEDGDAFAMLGRLYWQTQQYPDASSAFETASRLNPGDEDLAFMAVLAAGKIPGPAGAGRQLSALKRMVENHPDNAQAQKMLALAQGAAGELAASEAALSTWAGLTNDPSDLETYRAVVNAMDGDYGAAATALSTGGTASDAARLAQGYLASLEGNTETATAVLAGAVADTNDDVAAARLGLLYMAQGNFDKALPLLRPELGSPAADSARFFYALCLQTAGLEDDALLDFDRLVSGGGEFAEDAAVQMAIIYAERNQLERAEESIRKAKTFGTSARIYTVEGQVAALQGDLTVAQDFFRKAIQEENDYPAAHLEHGLAYVRRGALTEGVRELERYLELADGQVTGGRINEVGLLVKQLQQTLAQNQG